MCRFAPTLVLGGVLGAVAVTGASADVFTAGPDGEFSTIGQAISAARTRPGEHEIRAQQGEFVETIRLSNLGAASAIDLLGGWDATFTQRSEDSSTVVRPNGRHRVLEVDLGAGEFTLRGVVLADGRIPLISTVDGANALVRLRGEASALLADCEVRGGVIEDTGGNGAGVSFLIEDDAVATLANCWVHDNQLVATNTSATGAGVFVNAFDRSRVVLQANRLESNSATAAQRVNGGGAFVWAFDEAHIELLDNRFVGNRVTAGTSCVGAGATLWARESATVFADRNRWVDNRDLSALPEACEQVDATNSDSATVVVRNGEVWSGGRGLQVLSRGAGSIHLGNLTVVDHDESAVVESPGGGFLSLENSLLWGSDGPDLVASPDLVTALVTEDAGAADPLFVDPAGGDLRLQAESPWIDAGSADIAAGLGATDIEGLPRVQGAAVDVGAHEFEPLPPTSLCEGAESTLCLGGRFAVSVAWADASGASGIGRVAAESTGDSGLFWFFDEQNWELLVKVLDGCALNDHFWVYAAATTDLGLDLRFEDRETGAQRVYGTPSGQPADAIRDTMAFPCEAVAP